MKTKVKENQREEKIKEMRECKISKNNRKGITLIALVITIVVLLILASVSIAMLTGNNGILTRAEDAKIETALGTVKEQIELYQIEKKMDNKEVTPENLLAEGKVSRTVQAGEEDKYYMYYALKENSFEGMQGLGKGNIASLKDVFLIDDNLNVKYISANGKEYGDSLNNKVLEDETKIRFSSKAFSEYVSKISGVEEEEMKFKWMKNQTSLTIADPNVDSIQDLVFFPNLLALTIKNYQGKETPITTMDGIENCSKLEKIMIYEGPDKDYTAVGKLNNLKSFIKEGKGNDYDSIIEALKMCENLNRISLSRLNISSMKRISELSNKLTSIELNMNNISKIEGLENKTNLKTLIMSNNRINKIEGLEHISNLEFLRLDNNQITDILPLATNNKLNYLDLRGNSGIDGNRNNYIGEKLEKLNKIENILKQGGSIFLDINKLRLFTSYTKLKLNDQNMTTLEALEGLTELTSLELENNQITLEDKKSQEILKSMDKLESLMLNRNKISNAMPINSLKNLKKLFLTGSGNNAINLKQIEDIISNLDTLQVTEETFKTILECDANKITKLNIPNSGLTEIPNLSKFTKLDTIDIRGNHLKDYSNITNIKSLKNLNLSDSNLRGKDLDFSELSNLTTIKLANNSLWSEDLENLKALKNNTNLTINLTNNSIIDATALLELNSNTKIDLRNNINLSQDSKDKLKAKFGSNVQF